MFEIVAVANGWLIRIARDYGRMSEGKSTHVFNDFDQMTAWIKDNIKPCGTDVSEE